MTMRISAGMFLAICFLCLASASWAPAQEQAGQADLDQATQKMISAERLADLEEVIELCESAIAKGLDDDNVKFAQQLMTSALFQRAQQFSAPIFEQQPPNPRWPLLRNLALRDVNKAVELNSDFGDAHLLKAKLLALPGGDAKEARRAAGEAARSFTDDDRKKAESLLLRAALAEEDDERLADLNQALEVDPESLDARLTRGLHYLQAEENDKAIADFRAVLESDPDRSEAWHGLAEALVNQEKYDEALETINKAIAAAPEEPMGFNMRARIHALKEDIEAAADDLDQALKLDEENIPALLMRARVRQLQGESKAALEDVNRALELRPGLVQGLELRSALLAASDKLEEAIGDLRKLLHADPQHMEWRLQLALYHQADSRPRKAIQLFNEILEDDPQNVIALRGRGDAYISIGEHKKAVADLEAALKLQPENDGILNNLAWLLATSPDDEVRNGERAIELATKACEVTEYKEAHILSTLASGYAEQGDWENAIKWSEKAVELGEGEVKEQLENELKSYREKKPWRERQNVEEKPESKVPLDSEFQL
ncbi:MAG: tetratricopeptide repeat protein [Planctomycetes bacterium]|nr:tetratricopeptide repeat protein [Planctomycetota bacterium]